MSRLPLTLIRLSLVAPELRLQISSQYTRAAVRNSLVPGWECSLLARQELTAPPVPRAQSVLRSAPAYWLMSLRPMLVQIL